jgi:hypothetical protein
MGADGGHTPNPRIPERAEARLSQSLSLKRFAKNLNHRFLRNALGGSTISKSNPQQISNKSRVNPGDKMTTETV